METKGPAITRNIVKCIITSSTIQRLRGSALTAYIKGYIFIMYKSVVQ